MGLIGLNMRRRGGFERKNFKFRNPNLKGNGNTYRRTMITPGQTGMYCPRGPSFTEPQVSGDTSGYNVNSLRPAFGKFHRRNINKKFEPGDDSQHIDLAKPWITEEIEIENKKKEGLLEVWTKTKSNEDWKKYNAQKYHVQTIHCKAKTKYLASHPSEVLMWENISPARYYCETCDKSFKMKDDLLVHEAGHETCSKDGCEFKAHPKIISKHIKMQHDSGLFKRIGNLYTEEEIAKWIEERKKRYPTREVIRAKKVLEEEKLKRGERIKDDNSRFNKSKWKKKSNFGERTHKLTKQKRSRRKNCNRNRSSIVQKEIEEEEAENFRKGVPAFMGIGNILSNAEETRFPVERELDISDDEWRSECPTEIVSKPQLNSSLGFLAEFYNSDEDSETRAPGNEIRTEGASGDEGSGPEEVKTISSKFLPEENSDEKLIPLKKFSEKQKLDDGRKKRNISDPCYTEKKLTLLEKLLKKEIRHERNVILQCIHFVVNHNFFTA